MFKRPSDIIPSQPHWQITMHITRPDRTAACRRTGLGVTAYGTILAKCRCAETVARMVVQGNQDAGTRAMCRRDERKTQAYDVVEMDYLGSFGIQHRIKPFGYRGRKKIVVRLKGRKRHAIYAQTPHGLHLEPPCTLRRRRPSGEDGDVITPFSQLHCLPISDDLRSSQHVRRKEVADHENTVPLAGKLCHSSSGTPSGGVNPPRSGGVLRW